MSSRDLNLAMRISADVSSLLGELAKGEDGLRQFSNAASKEMGELGIAAGSVEGKLAKLDAGVSELAAGMPSSKLEKDLKQLQLNTAGAAQETDELKQSWREAQTATGQGLGRINGNVSRLRGELNRGEGSLRKFGAAARRELGAIGNFAGSLEGRLAQLGLGVSAAAAGMQSAKLDKDLKQLQLTAGATADEAARLRQELLGAQVATGQSADELKAGVDALIAGGLSMAEATATVVPMSETLAVAKTNADALAKAMGVAATQFDIDLSKTEQARLLLDKMVVAGRAGNAELENLPDLFARVGSSAKSSNLSLNQTLALIETLSLVEPNAERLGTLVDSTLRVFTNANYMKDAQKATGVRFFDADGSRRDALKVIEDIKAEYDKLDTDAQRFRFISAAFGKADLDTQRGLKTLLDGDSLTKLDKVFGDVGTASGTIARDLPDAIGNAVDQAGRLKGALREAADDFAKPINEAISGAIKWGLDSKDNGGLGLSGGEIIAGGALGALGLFGAARYGGKAIQGLAGKLGGTAAGVATGKALEEAAGVTPVFVVNMPGDGLGGKLGTAEAIAGKGGSVLSKLPVAAGAIPAVAGVAGAGLAGVGIGTLISKAIEGTAISDAIGKAVAYAISPFSEEARAALEASRKPAEVAGKIEIHVTSDGKARVTQLQSSGGVDMSAYTGRTGAGS